ncbi:hypothetical protein ScalyP_jg6167 [Parmales sp. scaly parma]|nr:hypothetical protein ScalyP_jg6167 [Parmales sp. scaly parma]
MVKKLIPKVALLASMVIPLMLTPYSKVEESFHTQATYDIMHNNFNLSNYDHIKFPGVVPRTFFGAAVLSFFTAPLSLLLSCLPCLPFPFPFPFFWSNNLQPFIHEQFLLRLVLLLFNYFSFLSISRSLDSPSCILPPSSRPHASSYFLLVTSLQPHLTFYSSRTLPNTFSLILTSRALSHHLQVTSNTTYHASLTATLLVAAATLFRCDVLILIFTTGLSLLLSRRLSIFRIFALGAASLLLSLLLSSPLDSLLWGRGRGRGRDNGRPTFVWPEGEVLLFNTILGQNRSSDYGTSPWHWYLTSAIPRAMLGTLLLVPLGADRRLGEVVGPIGAFVGLYSLLPHKELRFVFPAIVGLNVVAGVGMGRLHEYVFAYVRGGRNKNKGMGKNKGKNKGNNNSNNNNNNNKRQLLAGAVGLGLMGITGAGTVVFLGASRLNYPGGVALKRLLEIVPVPVDAQAQADRVRVHVDVAAAMSGVSLFGFGRENWEFTKSGYEEENENDLGGEGAYDYAITEIKPTKNEEGTLLETVEGFDYIDYRRGKIVTSPKLFIVDKKNNFDKKNENENVD